MPAALRDGGRERALDDFKAVWQRNQQKLQMMTQGLASQSPEGRAAAANAYVEVAQDFIQHGINPKPLQESFEFMIKQEAIWPGH